MCVHIMVCKVIAALWLFSSQPSVGISEGCSELSQECITAPCLHGLCQETATSYHCDCSSTPFTGRNCQTPAKLVAFDCEMDYNPTIAMTPPIAAHTDDISLRFRTLKADGLLFKTVNRFTRDELKVYLQGGRVMLSVNLNGQREVSARWA